MMKPSEVLNFDLVARVKGDRKRLYRVAVPANKGGMMRMIALDPTEQYGRTVHRDEVAGIQSYLKGNSGEFFDKLQELTSKKGSEIKSCVLEAIEFVNNDKNLSGTDAIQTYNAELFESFWNYINPFLVTEEKEDKPKSKKSSKK